MRIPASGPRRPRRALMRSSSTPPAVVTTTSTMRCCTRKRTCSRTPALARLDVNPRKILARVAARAAGARPASAGPGGSSLRRQAIWRARGVRRARTRPARRGDGRHEPLSRAQVNGVRCCTKTQPATRCSAGPFHLMHVLVRRQCWLVGPVVAVVRHALTEVVASGRRRWRETPQRQLEGVQSGCSRALDVSIAAGCLAAPHHAVYFVNGLPQRGCLAACAQHGAHDAVQAAAIVEVPAAYGGGGRRLL